MLYWFILFLCSTSFILSAALFSLWAISINVNWCVGCYRDLFLLLHPVALRTPCTRLFWTPPSTRPSWPLCTVPSWPPVLCLPSALLSPVLLTPLMHLTNLCTLIFILLTSVNCPTNYWQLCTTLPTTDLCTLSNLLLISAHCLTYYWPLYSCTAHYWPLGAFKLICCYPCCHGRFPPLKVAYHWPKVNLLVPTFLF